MVVAFISTLFPTTLLFYSFILFTLLPSQVRDFYHLFIQDRENLLNNSIIVSSIFHLSGPVIRTWQNFAWINMSIFSMPTLRFLERKNPHNSEDYYMIFRFNQFLWSGIVTLLFWTVCFKIFWENLMKCLGSLLSRLEEYTHDSLLTNLGGSQNSWGSLMVFLKVLSIKF